MVVMTNKMNQLKIKNDYVRKPKKCPACKQERVVPIVYGYPTPEAAEGDKYFLAGLYRRNRSKTILLGMS